MRERIFRFGHYSSPSLKEKRLCFQHNNPSSAPQAAPNSSWVDVASEKIEKFFRGSINLTTDVTAGIARILVALPAGIVKGIGDGFEKYMPTKQERIVFLNRVGQFFNDIPSMLKRVTEWPTLEFETLRNLTDHAQWIKAFNVQALTQPAAPQGTVLQGIFGPAELLAVLSPAERQEIFRKYVDVYLDIPKDVQAKMVGKGVDWMTASTDEQRADLVQNAERVGDVMKKMFGMPDDAQPDTVSDQEKKQREDFAKESLLRRYSNQDPNGPISYHLMRDVQDAWRGSGLPQQVDALTSPSLLQDKVSPSLLKGALKLGVVDQGKLQQVFAQKEEIEKRITQVAAVVAQNADVDTGASKERMRLESMNLMDRYQNMSGNEKLLLWGVGLIALGMSKKVRNIAIALVAGYFGTKFIMGTDDPVRYWSDLLKPGRDWLYDHSPKWAQKMTPNYRPDIPGRSEMMVRFLAERFDLANLEAEGRGFVLLADSPLGEIARNFDAKQDGSGQWSFALHAERGSTLDKTLAALAEKWGWKKGYRSFFEDARHAAAVSEALGYVFYLRAADDPANQPLVDQVEKVVGRMPVAAGGMGACYARLQALAGRRQANITGAQPVAGAGGAAQNRLAQDEAEAADAYGTLVAKGRTMAMNDGGSLLSYLEGKTTARRAEGKPERKPKTPDIPPPPVRRNLGVPPPPLMPNVAPPPPPRSPSTPNVPPPPGSRPPQAPPPAPSTVPSSSVPPTPKSAPTPAVPPSPSTTLNVVPPRPQSPSVPNIPPQPGINRIPQAPPPAPSATPSPATPPAPNIAPTSAVPPAPSVASNTVPPPPPSSPVQPNVPPPPMGRSNIPPPPQR